MVRPSLPEAVTQAKIGEHVAAIEDRIQECEGKIASLEITPSGSVTAGAAIATRREQVERDVREPRTYLEIHERALDRVLRSAGAQGG